MKIKKLIFFWAPPLFWMGMIYFFSSFHKLQASPVAWQDFILRKTTHFLEYAVLFILNNRGLKNTTSLGTSKRLVLSFFLTVFYALSDEFHQTKVDGRTGRPFDIGVDTLGGFFGLIFSEKIIYLLPKKIQEMI